MSEDAAYLENLRGLSDRLVQAQAPIRILDAIKWNDSVQNAFLEPRIRSWTG